MLVRATAPSVVGAHGAEFRTNGILSLGVHLEVEVSAEFSKVVAVLRKLGERWREGERADLRARYLGVFLHPSLWPVEGLHLRDQTGHVRLRIETRSEIMVCSDFLILTRPLFAE